VPCRVVAQDRVKDRHQISQALPGPGAGRDDIVVATARRRQRLRLMAVQLQTRSEEPGGVRGNGVAGREFAERRSGLVSRIELQDSFGPQFALGEPLTHKLVDPGVENVNKALDIIPGFPDNVFAKAEYVEGHVRSIRFKPEAAPLARPRGFRKGSEEPCPYC
jgi:hypothetical protein